ncbi:MAG TPA: FAD synthetase family protein [Spirochaetia bacterium]|nr:FAD synthetase family protein [Spirochaetia bacterium]
MRIIEWERDDPLSLPHGVSMTIGVFDALHLGHRELIHRIQEREFGADSLVITFRDNPLKVLQPGGYPGNVLTLDQKLERIAALGVRSVLLIDFSLDFSKMSGTEFILKINALFRPHLLVLGTNFRCGHRNDTNAGKVQSLLGSQGVRVDIVEPVLDNGIPVSSTRIRAAIQAGDLSTARRLLGSDYFLELGGAAVQMNHQVYLVDAGDLTQVLPAAGTFDVTMYQGLPSFKGEYRREVSAGTVHPAPIRTRVTIDHGSLRWPKEIGSGYSHVRFDGTTG